MKTLCCKAHRDNNPTHGLCNDVVGWIKDNGKFLADSWTIEQQVLAGIPVDQIRCARHAPLFCVLRVAQGGAA
jgi:hypothetical protein